MRTYKMYTGAMVASANNICSTQILRNGRVKSIRYALDVDCSTDNSNITLEVSINPTSQIALGTIQGALDEIRWCGNGTAALGFENTQRNLDFAVGAGEYLYINSTVAGTLSARATVFVDIDEGAR